MGCDSITAVGWLIMVSSVEWQVMGHHLHYIEL